MLVDSTLDQSGGYVIMEDPEKTYQCNYWTCTKEAEFEIYWGSKPDEYAHTCLEHIPDFITEHEVHNIYRL